MRPFVFQAESRKRYLLAHRAMPFQVFVLFDFVVQLNVDWMPVEVFMQATARLLQVLTVAEGTSAGRHICPLFIHVTIQTLPSVTAPHCAGCAM